MSRVYANVLTRGGTTRPSRTNSAWSIRRQRFALRLVLGYLEGLAFRLLLLQLAVLQCRSDLPDDRRKLLGLVDSDFLQPGVEFLHVLLGHKVDAERIDLARFGDPREQDIVVGLLRIDHHRFLDALLVTPLALGHAAGDGDVRQ